MFKNTKGQWDWFKILLPIIIVLFMGMTKIIYTNVCELVATKANAKEVTLKVDGLKKDLSTKAKESDMKQMLILFEQRTTVLEKDSDKKAVEQEALRKEMQQLNLNFKIWQIQNESKTE